MFGTVGIGSGQRPSYWHPSTCPRRGRGAPRRPHPVVVWTCCLVGGWRGQLGLPLTGYVGWPRWVVVGLHEMCLSPCGWWLVGWIGQHIWSYWKGVVARITLRWFGSLSRVWFGLAGFGRVGWLVRWVANVPAGSASRKQCWSARGSCGVWPAVPS